VIIDLDRNPKRERGRSVFRLSLTLRVPFAGDIEVNPENNTDFESTTCG